MSEKNFEIWIEDVQALRPDALRGDLAALQAGAPLLRQALALRIAKPETFLPTDRGPAAMGTVEGRPAGANAQFGCSCHCGGGAGGPRLKRQDSGGIAAAEIPVRVASSPDVKIHEETKGRSDASPSQLSISKAAVQAAHNLATGASDSTQSMSDAADEPAPAGESRAKHGTWTDGEGFKISQYHAVARRHRAPRDDSDDQKISLEKLERSLEVLHRRHQESLALVADLLVSLPDLSAVTEEVPSVQPGGPGAAVSSASTFADTEVAAGTDHPDPTSSMTAEVACPMQEEVSEVKTPFDAVQKMVCIGFDLQFTLDGSDSPVFVTVSENVFLLVYTIEFVLRVLSMGWFAYYTDPWCLLDFTLLVCGAIGGVVVPVLKSTGQDMVSLGWLQSILVIRALRLLRLVRALRALTYFRTVWRLVHGLLTSWNAMLSTLALITLTLYTSACIAIEIVTKDVELNSNPNTASIVQANFSSLGTTFLTLTQFVALDSAAAVYKPSLGLQNRQGLDKALVEAKPILIFYFGSIVLFVSIALMNLVTAVLVEGALNHAQTDRDLEKIDRNERLSKALTRLITLFADMDKNGDGTVTLEEMQAVPPNLLPPEIFEHEMAVTIAEVFQVLDVDDQGTLDQREFVEGLLAVYLQDMPLAQLETLKLLQKQNHRLDEIYKVLRPRCPKSMKDQPTATVAV
eukprot:s1442_g15.t1